jgi:transketolase
MLTTRPDIDRNDSAVWPQLPQQPRVTVRADGRSQLALKDIARFRAIPDSTVLVASDANQTAALAKEMRDRRGVIYLRAPLTGANVIYPPREHFPIGGSRTLRASQHDHVTLLAAGATVPEALAAAELLAARHIQARVIDLQAARETGNLIVTEDHGAHGGLGDAVQDTLADADSEARVRRLAVHTTPTSGRPEQRLWRSGIDRTWIDAAARDLLEQPPAPNRKHRRRARAWTWGR